MKILKRQMCSTVLVLQLVYSICAQGPCGRGGHWVGGIVGFGMWALVWLGVDPGISPPKESGLW